MKKIKSDKLESLCELLIDLFKLKAFKKAIFSKPDSSDEIKCVVSPIIIKNLNALQIETFSKDNKAYHFNITDNFYDEIINLFYTHSQINLISTGGDCQYMCSKSGKETLIGEKKIRELLNIGNFEKNILHGNNRNKKYILNGDEDFLKKLGISDENGRIRDKMQAKFRQINKFLEHIESVRKYLPDTNINIYDLCCGKSYLSFAVYHYFKNILKIDDIHMVCVDLKSDVIDYCSNVSKRLGFDDMNFVYGDIMQYQITKKPHLVISLHACDTATDIVLNKASENNADVILSTPCCHHMLNHNINCPSLSFITKHSMLRQKLCDSATDAMRLLKLESLGYEVAALELIDPEDTPKNIILRAIRKKSVDKNKIDMLKKEYKEVQKFLLGENNELF